MPSGVRLGPATLEPPGWWRAPRQHRMRPGASERFRNDPPSNGELHAARLVVTEEVVSAQGDLPRPGPNEVMIGLAGTVSTLVCLDRGITEYDRETGPLSGAVP